MDGISVFVVTVGVLCATGAGLSLWRWASLRSKGTQVIMRPLPAGDGHAWRHGVMMYSDSLLNMYKLRSLRPGADVRFSRRDIEIVSRRQPSVVEAGFFDPGLAVIGITSQSQGEWELALDSSGDTAFVAWVESSPSARQTRSLPTNIEQGFRASRQRGQRF
ncbi:MULTISPECIES: DUF2550 domain-containing protein [unclassified Corynebacterium]|uniref:DUF2550 domain-containing protein n=1 Tax=unclassified Corynebacterium TaxID=2624378 RepID=UPI0030A82B94